MKQKLRVTITKIRRQTISSSRNGYNETIPQIIGEAGGSATARAIVLDQTAERNIREINAPIQTMPDNNSNQK